ncbi:MAG: acylphosphatase [Nitrososphaerota archaeon]|nr:acylphosphatase [Nitrososphaerota archaeon]
MGDGSRREMAELLLSGDVQGVGLRSYAEGVALSLGLTGFIQNLEDGRVMAVCEGTSEKISEFLTALKEAPPPIRVRRTTVKHSEATGRFATFSVTRSPGR